MTPAAGQTRTRLGSVERKKKKIEGKKNAAGGCWWATERAAQPLVPQPRSEFHWIRAHFRSHRGAAAAGTCNALYNNAHFYRDSARVVCVRQNKQKHWKRPSGWFRNNVPQRAIVKTDHQPIRVVATRSIFKLRRCGEDAGIRVTPNAAGAAWCQTGGSEYFTKGDFQNIAATSQSLERRAWEGKNSQWVAAVWRETAVLMSGVKGQSGQTCWGPWEGQQWLNWTVPR